MFRCQILRWFVDTGSLCKICLWPWRPVRNHVLSTMARWYNVCPLIVIHYELWLYWPMIVTKRMSSTKSAYVCSSFRQMIMRYRVVRSGQYATRCQPCLPRFGVWQICFLKMTFWNVCGKRFLKIVWNIFLGGMRTGTALVATRWPTMSPSKVLVRHVLIFPFSICIRHRLFIFGLNSEGQSEGYGLTSSQVILISW